MSRFIDRLKKASQPIPQPMGFRAKQSISKQGMLLVASLSGADAKEAADYLAGADAGLLPVDGLSAGAKKLKEIARLAPDVPWGGLLEGNCRGGVKQLIRAGCDFIVFTPETSLEVLGEDKVGRILAVTPLLSDGEIRAVGELPADAVFITAQDEKGDFLSWRHLISFKRFCGLLNKPLLVSVPLNVTVDELQVLWDAGVDGVVVDVDAGQPAGKLKELRQMIDSLVLPEQRKRAKTAALIPRVGGEAGTLVEEEEEEDDEEYE